MTPFRYTLVALLFLALSGCNEDETPNPYTANRQVYALSQSSDFPVSGTATFLERRDGQVEIRIALTGTEGDIQHPAHLHEGDVSATDSEVALMLSPVSGITGESVTLVSRLNDETNVTYADMIRFAGHIKVHLDADVNKSVILASGNVGSLAAN